MGGCGWPVACFPEGKSGQARVVQGPPLFMTPLESECYIREASNRAKRWEERLVKREKIQPQVSKLQKKQELLMQEGKLIKKKIDEESKKKLLAENDEDDNEINPKSKKSKSVKFANDEKEKLDQ